MEQKFTYPDLLLHQERKKFNLLRTSSFYLMLRQKFIKQYFYFKYNMLIVFEHLFAHKQKKQKFIHKTFYFYHHKIKKKFNLRVLLLLSYFSKKQKLNELDFYFFNDEVQMLRTFIIFLCPPLQWEQKKVNILTFYFQLNKLYSLIIPHIYPNEVEVHYYQFVLHLVRI